MFGGFFVVRKFDSVEMDVLNTPHSLVHPCTNAFIFPSFNPHFFISSTSSFYPSIHPSTSLSINPSNHLYILPPFNQCYAEAEKCYLHVLSLDSTCPDAKVELALVRALQLTVGGWTFGGLVGCLVVVWLVGWLFGGLVSHLVGWLAGWVVFWVVGE